MSRSTISLSLSLSYVRGHQCLHSSFLLRSFHQGGTSEPETKRRLPFQFQFRLLSCSSFSGKGISRGVEERSPSSYLPPGTVWKWNNSLTSWVLETLRQISTVHISLERSPPEGRKAGQGPFTTRQLPLPSDTVTPHSFEVSSFPLPFSLFYATSTFHLAVWLTDVYCHNSWHKTGIVVAQKWQEPP